MTNTGKVLASAAALALAGVVTFVATKEEGVVEGNYTRVRQCSQKRLPPDAGELQVEAKPEVLAAEPVREDWNGAKPAEVECEWLTVLELGGKQRVVSREPAQDTGLKTEVFAKGEAGGFECACSAGKNCEWPKPQAPGEKGDGGWVTAPNGITLAKGQWRGADCFRKSCVELASRKLTSWPEECSQ